MLMWVNACFSLTKSISKVFESSREEKENFVLSSSLTPLQVKFQK